MSTTKPDNHPNEIMRSVIRGLYDLQKLRIMTGNRVVGNFKAKLGQKPSHSEDTLDPDSRELLAVLRAKAPRITDTAVFVGDSSGATESAGEPVEIDDALGKEIITLLVRRYQAVTDKRKTFPIKATFTGDPVISDYTELCMVGQYVDLLRHEQQHTRRLENMLADYPVWTGFLAEVRGVGPMMAAVIISEFDIHKAKYPSSLWRYAGLDVADDGKAQSMRAEHLVEVHYRDKNGQDATRMAITFNPWLRSKLIGVLGSSFIKQSADLCRYRRVYDDYKHRLEQHAMYGVEVHKIKGAKGHRHAMAIRYMVKMFLIDLYKAWRAMEGLPVHPPYHEAKLGLKHAG